MNVSVEGKPISFSELFANARARISWMPSGSTTFSMAVESMKASSSMIMIAAGNVSVASSAIALTPDRSMDSIIAIAKSRFPILIAILLYV